MRTRVVRPISPLGRFRRSLTIGHFATVVRLPFSTRRCTAARPPAFARELLATDRVAS